MIKVRIERLETLNEQLYSYDTELKNLAKRMLNLHDDITTGFYGSGTTAQIKKKVENLHTRMSNEQTYIKNLASALESCLVFYRNAETNIVESITGKDTYAKVTKSNNSVDKKAAEASTKEKYTKSKLKFGGKPYPTTASGLRDYMAKYMMLNWGLTDIQAAAILGNICQESSYYPTNKQGGTSVDESWYISQYSTTDGAGWGICQWTYSSRKQGLLDYAKKMGTDVGDLDTQLEYLYQELHSTHSGAWSQLKKATTLEEATKVFCTSFEGPGVPEMSKRISYAKEAYNAIQKF